MKAKSQKIVFPFDCESVLAMFSLELVAQGIRLGNSSELDGACASFTESTCPHDRSSACKCRLVTFFVSEENTPAIPLVVHGHAGQTEVSIEANLDQDNIDFINRVWAILIEQSEIFQGQNG